MPLTPDLPQTEIAIVEMTNAFRRQNALQEVKPNPVLAATARAFAEFLAQSGQRLGHEADGRAPAERAEAQGYQYCMVSENLAMNLDSRGFETRALAREAVEGWKGSPGHRANMLQPAVTEIGVAVARAPDKNPKYISVQVFGRPESLKVEFSIENRSGADIGYRLGEEEHTLPPRAISTHTSCDAGALTFDKAGVLAQAAAPLKFAPRDGERYLIRAGGRGVAEIVRERQAQRSRD